jgi:hypothetical protein
MTLCVLGRLFIHDTVESVSMVAGVYDNHRKYNYMHIYREKSADFDRQISLKLI